MKPTLLILAAGMGSRYGGLKQLDRIGPSGETIIDYSIYDAIRAGFGKVIFIIKEAIEDDFRVAFVERLRNRVDIDYVFQEIRMVPDGINIPENRSKPWGTGHAILMAADKINEPFAVINADDFYGRGAFTAMAAHFKHRDAAREGEYCMIGYPLGNTLSEFGAVSRGVCQRSADGSLAGIEERTQISHNAGMIVYCDETGREVPIAPDTVVSMNFWGFTPSLFGFLKTGFRDFIRKNAGDLKAEYFIPYVVNDLIRSGQVKVKILDCNETWFGMTYREDRLKVEKSIAGLVQAGIYPEKLWGSSNFPAV